jgi:hypothetical protein
LKFTRFIKISSLTLKKLAILLEIKRYFFLSDKKGQKQSTRTKAKKILPPGIEHKNFVSNRDL